MMVPPDPTSKWDGACNFIYTSFRRFRFVSVLTELNIALSFVIIVLIPKECVLLILRRLLFLLWITGSVLSLLEFFTDPGFYAPKHHMCNLRKEDYISIYTLVITSGISMCAYIVLTAMMLVKHSQDLRRAWCLSAMYPLNFLISYGLIVMLYLSPPDFQGGDLLMRWADFLEGLGGFLNVLVYWLGARRLSHLLGEEFRSLAMQ